MISLRSVTRWDAVRVLLVNLGADFIDGCSLSVERSPSGVEVLAEGQELVELALAAAGT